jgi:hypothetical protein
LCCSKGIGVLRMYKNSNASVLSVSKIGFASLFDFGCW